MKLLLRSVAAIALLIGGGAAAQTYPEKPIRLIVPFDQGGLTSNSARIMAKAIEDNDLLPVPIIISYVPGAAGTIGARQVKDSKPDGYTALIWHVAANGAQALPTAPVPSVGATVGLSPHPASPEQGGGGALMQPLSEPVSPPRAPHQACYVMGMLREWDLTFDMELDMHDIEEARQHLQDLPAYRTGYRDIDSDNDSSCDDRSCDGGSSTIGDSDSDEGIDSSSVGDSDPDDDVDMDLQVANVFASAPTFDLADVMALPLLPPLSARAQVPPAVPPEPAAVPGTVPRRAAAAQATPPAAVKPAAQQAKRPRSAPPAVVSAPLSPSWATTGTPAVAAAPPGPASMPTAATAGNGSGLPITPRLLACV